MLSILILEIHKPMGWSISHESKIKDHINSGIGNEILVHTSDFEMWDNPVQQF